MNKIIRGKYQSSTVTRSTVLLIVSLAVLFQANVVFNKHISPMMNRISNLSGESMMYRAAYLFHGVDFAEYIKFLRETVPEDARVLLPPREPVQPMANVGLMHFFLFPRELHNCGVHEVEACLLRMEGSDFYVVTAWKFPPQELANQVRRFIPLQGDEGVYGP